jgi:hypothetical protein
MTFTDSGVSATGTYAYEVATVNWSNVTGPKSATLTLKNGLVSVAPQRFAGAPVTTPARISLVYSGNRTMLSGRVALFDIRGRLLARAEIPEGHRADLKGVLGNKTNNLVVARIQAGK